MASEPTLDPDLEQVLVDIAADPRAKLFSTDARRMVRGLQDGSLQVKPSRTGLRPAERHLVEVYRCELAQLLLVYHADALKEANTPVVNFHELPPRSERERSVKQLILHSDDEHQPELDLLADHISKRRISASQRLLFASLKVDSTPTARTFLANHYIEHGQLISARSVIEQVLEQPNDVYLDNSAHLSKGLILFESNQLPAAVMEYERALRIAERGGLPVEEALLASTNILELSLGLGNLEKARSTCAWIDQSVDHEQPSVSAIAQAMRWGTSSPEARKHAMAMRSEVGSTSREFLDAII